MKIKPLLYIFISTLLIALFPANLKAETRPTAADFLVEVGESYYNQNRIDDAIHEFSKALLVDPDHKKAKAYLSEFGIVNGLYSSQQTHSTQKADLGKQIKSYKIKLTALESEKGALEKKLLSLMSKNEDLMHTVSLKSEKINGLKTHIKAMALSSDVDLMKADDYAKALQEAAREPEVVVIKYVREEPAAIDPNVDQELTKITEAVASPVERYAQALQESRDHQQEMMVLSAKYNNLRDQLSLRKVKDNFMFQVIDEYLYLREQDIHELKNDLIYNEMDITKKDYKLLSNYDELLKIYSSYEKIQSKLHASEELNEKKNSDIHSLREQLKSSQ